MSDEQWANHNRVIEIGLHVRDEWRPGKLIVHEEQLELDGWNERPKPWCQSLNPTQKYRWGEDVGEVSLIATAIFRLFLGDDEMESTRDDFIPEVAARFPQRKI